MAEKTLRQTFSGIADAMRSSGIIGAGETVRPLDMGARIEGAATVPRLFADQVAEFTVDYIPSFAFYDLNNLKTVHSNASVIGESAFSATDANRSDGQGIHTFTSSRDFEIGQYAFRNCFDLDWATFPWDKVRALSGSAFALKKGVNPSVKVDTVTLPALTTLSGGLEYWCSRRVDLPSVTEVTRFDVGLKTALTEIRAENLERTGMAINSANGCNLITLHCPKLKYFYGIQGNSSAGVHLRYVGNTLDEYGNPSWTDLSGIETASGSLAYYMNSLVWKHKWCYLPNLTNLGEGQTFRGCASSNLRGVWLGPNDTLAYLGSYCFYQCPSQLKVFLPRKSKIYGNKSSGSYNSFATCYVPASLLDEYKAATNWSGMTSRLVGLTDEQFAAVEQQIRDGVDADAITIPTA